MLYLRTEKLEMFKFNFIQLTTKNHFFMKKALLFGTAALFSLALLATSCGSDDDDTCVTCTDDGVEYDVCWGNPIEMVTKLADFTENHPNASCDDVED